MLINAIAGQPAAAAPGTNPSLRAGQLGDLIVSELHGKDYEQAYRKNMFFAYSAVATLTSANTTATGLIIWNSSTIVNLVMRKFFLNISVTSASMKGIMLAYGAQAAAPTGLTAATASGSTFIGAASPQGLAYAAATLSTTPVPFIPLMHNTAAIATTGVDAIFGDLDGSIIIPPGYAVSLSALGAASAASAVSAALTWEEVPV